jgi:hypothetical protein
MPAFPLEIQKTQRNGSAVLSRLIVAALTTCLGGCAIAGRDLITRQNSESARFSRTSQRDFGTSEAKFSSAGSQDRPVSGGWSGLSADDREENTPLQTQELLIDEPSRWPRRTAGSNVSGKNNPSGIRLQKPRIPQTSSAETGTEYGQFQGPELPGIRSRNAVHSASAAPDSMTSDSVLDPESITESVGTPERSSEISTEEMPAVPARRSSVLETEPGTERNANSDIRQISRSTEAAAKQSETTNPSSDTADGTPESAPTSPAPREPTMLNRLRDLYSPQRDVPPRASAESEPPPREENTSEMLKKQFRRIPGPWGLLREKPPESPTTPAATAELPPQTVAPPDKAEPVTPEQSIDADKISLTIGELIRTLENNLKEWPRDESENAQNPELWRRQQADLRLLYLLADRSGDAVSAIESLPPEEQELWQSMVMAMDHYRGPVPPSAEQPAADDPSTNEPGSDRSVQLMAVAEQLRAAVQHAQALSPLTIRRSSFCTAINGFANVDEVPAASFTAGQPVLIYVELDNFRSERTEAGIYRSVFSASLEIVRVDDQGEHQVDVFPLPSIEDEATVRRTDFFQSFELVIPSHLPEGTYQVRILLRDQLSQQQARATLPFTVRR